MKKLLTIFFLVTFVMSLFFFGGKYFNPVKADSGVPVTITATYNSSTGQLNTSGSYAWEECESGEETNILGYALFVNDGTPAVNNSDALDGSGMHLANSGNPCTQTPDNWADNSHVLSSAPTKVCVVVYDLRADDSADPEGIHSIIGAGGNYNTDNSWDLNNKSYPEGSCTSPNIISPTPISECEEGNCSSPAPTPSCTGDQHLDASGKNCVSFEYGGAPQSGGSTGGGQVLGSSTNAGQVLGASSMAKTGVSRNVIGSILTVLGLTVTVISLYAYKKQISLFPQDLG